MPSAPETVTHTSHTPAPEADSAGPPDTPPASESEYVNDTPAVVFGVFVS